MQKTMHGGYKTTCPFQKGRVLTANLYEGMTLQPYCKSEPQTPIEITNVQVGSKWLLAITLFAEPLFPHHRPHPEERSKADLGMEPYQPGVWNVSNYCTETKEDTDDQEDRP